MDESTKLGFTIAKDFHALLITLSTGVLTITLTFLKDISKGVPGFWKLFLGVGWLLLVVSIVFGLLSLMALTGTLVPAEGRPAPVFTDQIRLLAKVQVLTFLGGFAAVVIYGATGLIYHTHDPE